MSPHRLVSQPSRGAPHHEGRTAAEPARLRDLRESLALLNRDVPPEEACRDLLPQLVQSLGVETGAVLLAHRDANARVVHAFGPTRRRSFPYASLDLTDARLAAVVQRPGVVMLSGRHNDQLPTALAAVCRARPTLVAVAPAFAANDLMGLLVVSSRRGQLDPARIDQLSAIADGLGLALARSALTQESHQSEVVLETACAVARAISGSLDLERTFGQIALSAARVMGNCSCLLLQLEADTGDLVAVSASDREDDALIGLRIRFHDQDCPATVLHERRSIIVDDVVFGAGVEDACRERLKIRSALFVPISSEDGLIGSLLLYSTERRARYSPRDIARAETVAEQAAGAICNARLYHDLERSKAEGQALLHRITRLRERQRVDFANVVHDEILQTVVAALYEVESLREQTDDETDPDIDRVADLLKGSIAEARRMIFELRPAVLDGLGLAGALTALAERTGGEADAVVNVRIPDAPTLSSGVSTAVYMIAREALQNARRHAAPHRVEITLAATDDETAVLLEVRDDGCGFSPESLDGSEHFGLTMMDEQAALVGGRLRVESSPGVGTRITAVVPLEGSA